MTRVSVRRLTLTLGIALAAGCAKKSAQPRIDAADGVVAGAGTERARKCAPELMQQADDALAEARRLEREGDAEAAERRAGQAAELARRALAQSPEGCDEDTPEATEGGGALTNRVDGTDANRSVTLDDLASALQPIYFGYNLAVIREDARAILRRVAELLVALPGTQLEIEGHCDVRGSTEYNLHLGERRARAVLKYLVAQGVDATRLSYISYGEEKPVALGTTEADHQRNRRAELRLR